MAVIRRAEAICIERISQSNRIARDLRDLAGVDHDA